MKLVNQRTLFNFLKLTEIKRGGGSLVGLYVSKESVGVAVSMIDNKLVSLYMNVLDRKQFSIGLMADDFKNLISYFQVSGFVVGYPYDGAENGEDPSEVKRFLKNLSKTRKLNGIPYTFWDAMYTPKIIELLLKPVKLDPFVKSIVIDKFTAAGTLQGYLDAMNRKRVHYTDKQEKKVEEDII